MAAAAIVIMMNQPKNALRSFNPKLKGSPSSMLPSLLPAMIETEKSSAYTDEQSHILFSRRQFSILFTITPFLFQLYAFPGRGWRSHIHYRHSALIMQDLKS